MNPYEELGVSKSASQDEIKKAHRKLAKKYHPDATGGDKSMEEKFKKISEAYEILSDPNKKMQFDSFGSVGGRGGGSNDDMWGRFQHAQAQASHFGQRARTNMVNPDIRIGIRVSLSDAIFGRTIEHTLGSVEACDTCKNTGGKTENKVCEGCDGKGQVGYRPNPHTQMVTTCPHCQGTGKKFKKCDTCDGIGYSKRHEKAKIKIPPNVKPHAVIRLNEKGNTVYHHGGKITGDYFLVVDFPAMEKGITRQKGDLHMTVHVPIDKILAEDKISINCFDRENVEIKLSSTQKENSLYRMTPKFFPDGKLYIKVIPKLPSKYIDEEKRKELVKTLREAYGESRSIIHPSSNGA